jgi:hypothetical protein
MVSTASVASDWARVFAFGAGTVALACSAALTVGMVKLQHRRQIAWWASLRHAGWLPVVLSSAGVIGLIVFRPMFDGAATSRAPFDPSIVVDAVIPLAIAVQAALLFAPDDEPALEVLLAAPRPIYWLLLERYVAVFLLQSAVALGGIAVGIAVSGDTQVLLAIARWAPAAIFMSGLSMIVTVRSREPAMAIVITLLVSFVTIAGRDALLPAELGGSFFLPPFDALQPWLWLVHPHLNPQRVVAADYALNRLVITGIGCALIALAAHHLRDTERILLGVRSEKSRKTEA